jgi:uncharacterized protein (UPF0305 family)
MWFFSRVTRQFWAIIKGAFSLDAMRFVVVHTILGLRIGKMIEETELKGEQKRVEFIKQLKEEIAKDTTSYEPKWVNIFCEIIALIVS